LGYLTEKELSETFFSSRLYLLTSNTEGLTTAVVEGMMHGLPAIVSKVGNLPWLVRDGLDGHVIPHGNTKEMAKALAETLSDDKLLAKYKKNVRLRMLELKNVFTVEYISKIWEKLFNELKKFE
jgi:glycosyltransferase involved in cell wall biosynthesis